MECYLCYTKVVLFQLFLNTAFKSQVYLVWRQGRGSLRLSIPTCLVKTTEMKVVCFCLPHDTTVLMRLSHQVEKSGARSDQLLLAVQEIKRGFF